LQLLVRSPLLQLFLTVQWPQAAQLPLQLLALVLLAEHAALFPAAQAEMLPALGVAAEAPLNLLVLMLRLRLLLLLVVVVAAVAP
jgi:hypothetical protein